MANGSFDPAYPYIYYYHVSSLKLASQGAKAA